MAEDDTRIPTTEDDETTADEATADEAEEEEKHHCWICFATEEDNDTASWVQPCNCRGTTKWVHQACLQRWVDEKQKGNPGRQVACPQCNTPYTIVFPHMGMVVAVLDAIDNMMFRVCPFVAAGFVVGSLYWTAVTFGAITVMQVAGYKEGLAAMETTDPLVLLVGLPTIPVSLVLGKMVRWEDSVLHFLRRHSHRLPVLWRVLPAPAEERVNQVPPFSDPVSATRILCSALLLPTFALVCGKLLFSSVQSNVQRTVFGGLAFVLVKGVLKIYHKQKQHVRQSRRVILDLSESARAEPAQ
ncbi:E3 ubiquitin-protein ligase MARCHF5 isoform X2 [Bacillus rossius redtenbacheri]|uniref:E3 ubiquitin-protein ligase MARCHF5 isoform X2 n=1 Tax=Bacillus rossius redtenbacheri TaxID=93214 RepID=UPI002FDE0637